MDDYIYPEPLFHMDFSEVGIEELYASAPEPSVLDELTTTEAQDLNEWLGRLEQELTT